MARLGNYKLCRPGIYKFQVNGFYSSLLVQDAITPRQDSDGRREGARATTPGWVSKLLVCGAESCTEEVKPSG